MLVLICIVIETVSAQLHQEIEVYVRSAQRNASTLALDPLTAES
jgi:hypothetical protein